MRVLGTETFLLEKMKIVPLTDDEFKNIPDDINDNEDKEFPVNFENYTISRSDYLTMPLPMDANKFDDNKMRKLAKMIHDELSGYNFDKDDPNYTDNVDDVFWTEMERCAIEMGMEYFDE